MNCVRKTIGKRVLFREQRFMMTASFVAIPNKFGEILLRNILIKTVGFWNRHRILDRTGPLSMLSCLTALCNLVASI